MGLVLQRPSSQNPAFRHPIKVATILLQWNPKPKMILLAEVISPAHSLFQFDWSGGFSDSNKDLFK
jgi:hypothetical protein